MKLSSLTSESSVLSTDYFGDPEVARVVHDSRMVREGDLFCCIKGANTDGHLHAKAAVEAGAIAVLSEKVISLRVPVVLVDSVRETMPNFASKLVGDPSHELQVVGVTGTNGKTSVVSLLAGILRKEDCRVETIGTLNAGLTTPEAPELQRQLREYIKDNVEVVAMEVSSHSLVQHRVDAVSFSSVAFTNLSRDHLDYHSSMEEYYAAKKRLFKRGFSKKSVISIDDEYGLQQANDAVSEGLQVEKVSTKGINASFDKDSAAFDWRGERVLMPIGGPFVVANALVAAELAFQLGFEVPVISKALAVAEQVPGRFEVLKLKENLNAIVDYAHTPEALEELLKGCRKIVSGRIILIFGCGGNRDSGKRFLMGRTAELWADLKIVTSDNPRNEDPMQIISDVLLGMTGKDLIIEEDREAAIRTALISAKKDDLVVLAGRGHEEFQEVEGKKVPFSDKSVLLSCVGELQGPSKS